MGYRFRPCVSRTACNDNGERCLACGRSLDEVVEVRRLGDELTQFIRRMEYENSDDFLEYLVKKVRKKLKR